MNKINAAVVGFLVAPLVASIIGAVLTPVNGKLNFDLASIIGLLPIFYLFAALATALIGVPSFLLLYKCKLVSLWSALGVGVSAGVIVALVIKAPSHLEAQDLIAMAAMGSASTLSFWLIWRLGR